MTTTYFAYGSNMDPEQMARRCPGAPPLGIARLDGHRLAFTHDSPGWEGGVATVIPEPGAQVWGVLWALSPEHEATLDDYEGVAEGTYRRERMVLEAGAGPVEALVYVTNDTTHRAPSRAYLDALVRGATAFALPPDYVHAMAATPTA